MHSNNNNKMLPDGWTIDHTTVTKGRQTFHITRTYKVGRGDTYRLQAYGPKGEVVAVLATGETRRQMALAMLAAKVRRQHPEQS